MYPLSSALPFMATVGNHETNVAPGSCFSTNPISQQGAWPGPTATNTYGDDSGGDGGLSTYVRYRAPSNGQGSHWYSFDAGNVHFLHFSSEHDYRVGSPQRAFIERDLAAVDRSLTPWVIAAMHRPMFNARDDGDWSINQGMAAELEATFLSAKVDMAISAHYHNYMRSTSMRNYAPDASGASPVYITVGTGGATYHAEPFRNDSLAWVAADAAEWGFGVVDAVNRSHLQWTFRSNAQGGEVVDEVWIVRS